MRSVILIIGFLCSLAGYYFCIQDASASDLMKKAECEVFEMPVNYMSKMGWLQKCKINNVTCIIYNGGISCVK